jgi:hypothetical protein
MRKKIFLILLCITPVLFFFGMRLMRMIFSTEETESLKSEIIWAIIIGYGASLMLWNLERKIRKGKDSK